MRWWFDAQVLRALDALPGGDALHYLIQRHVTHFFPISDERLDREVGYARTHRDALGSASERPVALEFGAGRHLSVAMQLAAHGFRVHVVDVSPLMRADLVRDAARRMGDAALASVAVASDVASALRDLGVDYRVLEPSSFAGIADSSVDLVLSTSVLEHVPESQLPSLLREVRRVLAPEGRASFIVDYVDHFAHGTDVPSFNFLAIDRRTWFRRYSPSNHFQNRLRHGDVMALIEAAGLSVISTDVSPATQGDLKWLEAADLDEPFRDHALEDLGIRAAHIVSTLA